MPLSLSLSLSLVVVVGEKEREKESDMIKSDDEVFILRMMIFFPNALPSHHRENRFAPHNTLDAITNNKQKKKTQTTRFELAHPLGIQ